MSGASFYGISSGFLLGIFLHSIINFNLAEITFVLLLGVITLLLAILRESAKDKLIVVSIFIFALSLGMLRFYVFENSKGQFLLSNSPRIYEGIIVREPEYREKTTHVVTRLQDQNILLYVSKGQEFSYGDSIRFFGELEAPENFKTESGRIFDYQNFLQARGVDYVVQNPKVELLGSGNGAYIKEKLFLIKRKFLQSIERNIVAPESSLLSGLLLGVKESLGSQWEETIRRAGLSHVVVLSGFNITIVAMFFMWMFGFFKARIRIILGAIAIALFAITTGAEATVVRASLMALVVLLAHYLRRRYEVTRALILVGVAMVFVSPKILVFDISFQLSFLATVGIIYATPVIEKFFSFISNFAHIREIIVTTLATQLLVSPFILYAMGTFSIVSLPANLLVLPLVPIAMLIGFITGIVGLISSTLALPFAFIAYYILHFQLQVAKYFGNLSFSSTTIEPFPAWFLIPVYALILFVVFYLQRRIASS